MPKGLPPLILVVDDYDDNRFLCEESLRIAGFQVKGAADAESALAAARAQRPDLVLMDVRMPGMDGFEAVNQFKSDPRLAAVPIVILTAHAFPEYERRASEIGTAGFLRKPCLPSDVVDTVRRLLNPV